MLQVLLMILVSTINTRVAVASTESVNDENDLFMMIYHHIHHIELHNNVHPTKSVLLESTRKRLAKHLKVDYEDLLLPSPLEEDNPPLEPGSASSSNLRGMLNANHQEQQAVQPQQQSRALNSEFFNKIDPAKEVGHVDQDDGQDDTQNQETPSQIGSNFQSARTASPDDGQDDTQDQDTSSHLKDNFQSAKMGSYGGNTIGTSVTSTSPDDAETNGEKLARDLAEKQFKIDAVWAEKQTSTNRQYNKGNDAPECTEICKCLASELLFGITHVLPYDKNAEATGHEMVYQYRANWDTNMIWYRKKNEIWEWTPSDPSPSDTQKKIAEVSTELNEKQNKDFWDKVGNKLYKGGKWLVDKGEDVVEAEWVTCGSPAASGGAHGFFEWAGVTTNAEIEDLFFFQLLYDFNPGDNGGEIPYDTNPKRFDAKEDLRICSSRLKHHPSKQCECKKSECVQDLAGRYFSYIQLSENAVSDRRARRDAQLDWMLDAVSIGLDVLGMIDPFGIVADLLNAGLAAARDKMADAIISVVCAIPVIGIVIAPLKLIAKGVAGGTKKFLKWGKSVVQSLTHPKLVEFAKDLASQVSEKGSSAVTEALEGFAKVIKKLFSTFMYVSEQAAVVSKKIRAKVNEASIKNVKKEVGTFFNDILSRLGCFNRGLKKIPGWGATMFEIVGIGE